MGYHKRPIKKGEVGEISKIEEEIDELKEAIEQYNSILALVELSDIYGAIECYLEKHFSDFTMEDLKSMSDATRRAFEDGSRK